jgi:hypothetical protein
MRLLLLLALVLGAAAGCQADLRIKDDPPGKAKHADGPGNSENAPGHTKKK